ncbi:MAG: hypothetical protein HXK92_08965 [Lachnospiraceae bacterium]|nr:hypothetical protein [Lachnospiraceae bacterium]
MRTEKTVDDLCRKWQTLLRLRDWDIHVELFSAREFSEEDRQGEVFYDISTGQAIIHLLDVDAKLDTPFPYDLEKVLVHELLHLHFAIFEPEKEDSLRHDLWERTVEKMAQVMLRLHRQDNTEDGGR